MAPEGHMTALGIAMSRPVVRRALGYGVVVGIILISINHGDALLRGDLDTARALEMGLTVLVPDTVSTLSSVQAVRDHSKRTDDASDDRGSMADPGS